MTFEGGGTGDTPLMAWNRLGSLFALHSASYQGAATEGDAATRTKKRRKKKRGKGAMAKQQAARAAKYGTDV